MNIAILGIRGIPANYGGFETFAQNLSTRLVKRNHNVTVYCRSQYTDKRLREYDGVKLVVLPTIRHKYFDTVVHTFLSVFHVIFTDVQVVYFCNPVNSVFSVIVRLVGKKSIINVDGLEWKRKKWNKLAKKIFKISEYISTIFPNKIVADSQAIQKYYKIHYKVNTVFIPYGADVNSLLPAGELIRKKNLIPKKYILYVSRLEPENNAHIVVKAYEKTDTKLPLVIVGDAAYASDYVRALKSTKDRRIKFLGSIYGRGYFELLSNAYVYVHGNEVGGTNPALLEAMAVGNCVLVNGVDFNKEVIDDCGVWFNYNDCEDLKKKLTYLINNSAIVEEYRQLAIERIKKFYNWDDVVKKTEGLMQQLLISVGIKK